MKMIRLLNKRQDLILALLEKEKHLSISRLFAEIKTAYGKISKITVNRDLKKLIQSNFIVSKGKARSVFYELSPHYALIKPVDIEKYFEVETDKRIIKERFNFEIFPVLKDIFTKEESQRMKELNKKYQKNIRNMPANLLKKEFERLVIELSWKSSQIEGNTYSLLETETLIKEKKESKGHTKKEAMMILNHKDALDYIRKNKNDFKIISRAKIEDVHYFLTKDLNISKGLRKRTVGVIGTKYRPIDNQHQIREALEKTCSLINKEKNYFSKALLLSAMIAYIQPFEDGNKRTSRLTADAILMAYNSCPLSYRSVDDIEYKKAVILFYEQNNISYFKQLFIEQFEFAVKNYFR
ncbi:Fic family protein [Candidatus Peregrinibacteria bacterium]|nr:Fic family protein [Candidatus Peregrinibacteria bacterium]